MINQENDRIFPSLQLLTSGKMLSLMNLYPSNQSSRSRVQKSNGVSRVALRRALAAPTCGGGAAETMKACEYVVNETKERTPEKRKSLQKGSDVLFRNQAFEANQPHFRVCHPVFEEESGWKHSNAQLRRRRKETRDEDTFSQGNIYGQREGDGKHDILLTFFTKNGAFSAFILTNVT